MKCRKASQIDYSEQVQLNYWIGVHRITFTQRLEILGDMTKCRDQWHGWSQNNSSSTCRYSYFGPYGCSFTSVRCCNFAIKIVAHQHDVTDHKNLAELIKGIFHMVDTTVWNTYNTCRKKAMAHSRVKRNFHDKTKHKQKCKRKLP